MKINYGKVLIWSAIIVAVPRWAGAFIAADVSEIPQKVSEVLHYANLVAGVGMGFLEVVASAYLLEAWGKMKPKASHNAKSYSHKWKVLTGFVIGLFALMPFILAPYIVSRMTDVTIAQALGNSAILSYGWAVAVVLSPAFIVGGVAVANEDLMETAEAPKATQTRQQKATVAPQPQRQDVRRVSGELPTDWRQLSRQDRRVLAHAPREKREEMFPELAERTRREWHNRLDKIAAQNGEYVV